jgi:Subtilase family
MASISATKSTTRPQLGFSHWSNWLVKYSGKGIDPYLIWAYATQFRQLPRSEDWLDSHVSFLVESKSAMALDDASGVLLGAEYPTIYQYGLGATQNLPRFFTLRMPVTPQGQSNPIDFDLEKLFDSPEILRFQMGFTADSKSENRRYPPLTPIPFDGPVDVVVCALDDGCAFAHQHLRLEEDRAASRVVAMWDQSPRRNPTSPWSFPGDVPYGGQLVAPAIDTALQHAVINGRVDEDLVYEQVNSLYAHGLDQRHTHGAAVLDLLAGDTASERWDTDSLDGCVHANDAASKAPIVFVQFPNTEVTVPNGRWLATNALDGVHWAIRAAELINVRDAKFADRKRKVVINMSYGALAGPHDSTSMLVKALDEVCELRGNTAITVSAGNARKSDCHATLNLDPSVAGTLHVLIPAEKTAETYVEIWFPGFCDDSAVELTVLNPQGTFVSTSVKKLATFQDALGGSIAAIIFPRHVAQGTNGTMALLVVSATALDGGIPAASAGIWTLRVIDRCRPVRVDAWVERDEQSYGNNPQQQARFVNVAGAPVAIATENTLTNTAGGKYTFAVGSYYAFEQRIAEYSAEDSKSSVNGVVGTYAPTDGAHMLRGVRVAGTRTGMWNRPSGTSMAAPQLARSLANLLAVEKKSLTAKQVLARLPKAMKLNPSLKRESQLAARTENETEA